VLSKRSGQEAAADAAVLDGQVGHLHGFFREDVEHPVRAVAVDDRVARRVTVYGQVVGDVQVSGGVGVLARSINGRMPSYAVPSYQPGPASPQKYWYRLLVKLP